MDGQLGAFIAGLAGSALGGLTVWIATRPALQANRKQNAAVLKVHDDLPGHFERLAHDILKTNIRCLNRQNRTVLIQLLDPIKTRLEQVEEKAALLGSEGADFAQRLNHIVEHNRQLQAQTTDLAQAVKAANEAYMAGGEILLRRISETAALLHSIAEREHASPESTAAPLMPERQQMRLEKEQKTAGSATIEANDAPLAPLGFAMGEDTWDRPAYPQAGNKDSGMNLENISFSSRSIAPDGQNLSRSNGARLK